MFLFALAAATQVCAIIIPADVMEKNRYNFGFDRWKVMVLHV
jgi:hypothetical protein